MAKSLSVLERLENGCALLPLNLADVIVLNPDGRIIGTVQQNLEIGYFYGGDTEEAQVKKIFPGFNIQSGGMANGLCLLRWDGSSMYDRERFGLEPVT